MALLPFLKFYLLFINIFSVTESRRLSGRCTKKAISDAVNFIEEMDAKENEIYHEAQITNWDYITNVTKENMEKKTVASKNLMEGMNGIARNASTYPWKTYKHCNETLYRWFQIRTMGAPPPQAPIKLQEEEPEKNEENVFDKMTKVWEAAKLCPFNQTNAQCNINYDPDVMEIMGKSRNPDELKHYWLQFRRQTGEQYRNDYMKGIKGKNERAKAMGYPDGGAQAMAEYEEEGLREQLKALMNKIKPAYQLLHAYVRKVLINYYKNLNIKPDGPIPAHILGDMYAQKWVSLYGVVDPYPKKRVPNITDIIIKKKLKSIDLFIAAERFFVSIGMKRMTPHFWHYSLMERPHGREVQCHAAAHDMGDGKDFRIRMCATPSENSFAVIHHEMGHIEYFMYYSHLPFAFRDAPNQGIHEGTGETILLSSFHPDYLKEIGFASENQNLQDKEAQVSYLMYIALQYLVTVPYAFIVDEWRNKVYNGSIKEKNLNAKWWKLRLQYQGVCPPKKRTEKHFDSGAKFHIANDMEYNRYFIANILQFQFFKALCTEAGHKGPLFTCNLYKKKAAGRAFGEILKLGKLKPWQDLLGIITANKTRKLDAEPLLEYFDPLLKWLETENKNEYVGWKSDDPNQCP